MWALFGVHSYYKGLSMYILKYRSMGYRVKLPCAVLLMIFFFSSRRRHTRFKCDWSSDVCSSDLYSVWKPATSSDSASGRSNGARLFSAMPLITKITRPMGWYKTNQIESDACAVKIGRASCRERV